MNKYEVLYILPSNLEDALRESEIEKYSAAIKENGGDVENVTKIGVKKLCYPINFKNDGYYVLMNFQSSPEMPAELERRMGIDENVVRYMVTKRLK